MRKIKRSDSISSASYQPIENDPDDEIPLKTTENKEKTTENLFRNQVNQKVITRKETQMQSDFEIVGKSFCLFKLPQLN